MQKFSAYTFLPATDFMYTTGNMVTDDRAQLRVDNHIRGILETLCYDLLLRMTDPEFDRVCSLARRRLVVSARLHNTRISRADDTERTALAASGVDTRSVDVTDDLRYFSEARAALSRIRQHSRQRKT